MPDRLRLGLIFGGRSAEHEVSVVSAQHVIAAADRTRFEVVPIGVSKTGAWLSPAETRAALDRPDPPYRKQLEGASRYQPFRKTVDGSSEAGLLRKRAVREFSQRLQSLEDVDVVFPLIHGTHGEDGTLQGLLELAGLPYVGCGVAASAVGMDKALMKAVFASAGIPSTDYTVVETADWEREPLAAARRVEEKIGYPAFVKPANGGSSVGISKAQGREDLISGVAEASRFDRKLVIESAVKGREVECGVLGNAGAKASPVGEVRYTREFYDYEAKYIDPTTQIIAPTELPAETAARVQQLALRAFYAIDGAGFSRVDFFLREDGSLLIDEINTIPGFTPASMYPRLWQAAGVSYSELVTRLVDLGLARYREKRIA